MLGFAIISQGRSFTNVNNVISRDSKSNIFQEIKILKAKNKGISGEINDLERVLSNLSDQNLALDAIKKEIEKYKKLSGQFKIFGPGIEIKINKNISTAWIVDMVNELFLAGAQSVSVNNIRITNSTVGFDTLPQGQVLLNGSILSLPYTFKAIGEASDMTKILETPGGIFNRLDGAFLNLKIEVIKKNIIEME